MAYNLDLNILNEIGSVVPSEYQSPSYILVYVLFFVFYSFFVWKFHKFISKRNIISLSLKQHDYSEHPAFEKFLAILFYTFEYLVILPFLVLVWFVIFLLFLLFLSGSQTAEQILMISAAVIISSRIMAYVSEDLSRNFIKIFSFSLLAFFIFDVQLFNLNNSIQKLLNGIGLFKNFINLFIIIFLVEAVLRIIYSLYQIFLTFSPKNNEQEVISKKRGKRIKKY
jgi:hypothetical protein